MAPPWNLTGLPCSPVLRVISSLREHWSANSSGPDVTLSPGGEAVGSSPLSGPNQASPGLTWVVLHPRGLGMEHGGRAARGTAWLRVTQGGPGTSAQEETRSPSGLIPRPVQAGTWEQRQGLPTRLCIMGRPASWQPALCIANVLIIFMCLLFPSSSFPSCLALLLLLSSSGPSPPSRLGNLPSCVSLHRLEGAAEDWQWNQAYTAAGRQTSGIQCSLFTGERGRGSVCSSVKPVYEPPRW